MIVVRKTASLSYAAARRILLNSLREGTFIAILIASVMTILQALPLFWGRPFSFDWINHVWLVEYYSAFLREHLAFPLTIDATQAFGNPLPVFYGIFIYPLISLLGVLLGGDIAVRVACGALLVAPTIVYSVVICEFIENRQVAILLACAVSASVYQLTNIYARGALTEFIAHQLVLIALPLIIFGLSRTTRCAKASLAFGFACALMGCGTHPITLYLCLLIVAPLLLLLAPVLKLVALRSQMILALLYATCCASLLLPWAALAHLYRADLKLSLDSPLSEKLYYFPLSIDSFWAKTGIGLDTRTLFEGLSSASTPFLEAPWPVCAGFALGALLTTVRSFNRRLFYWSFFPTALIMALLVVLSLAPAQSDLTSGIWPGSGYVTGSRGWMYQLLIPIQFAYRLSNTFSIAISVSLVMCAALLSHTGDRLVFSETARTMIFIGAALALMSTAQKTFTTYAEYKAYPPYVRKYQPHILDRSENGVLFLESSAYKATIKNVGSYPIQFYSINEFAMSNAYPVITDAEISDRATVKADFSMQSARVAIRCITACVIKTNVIPTTFQQIFLDGERSKGTFVGPDLRLLVLAERGEHELAIASEKGKLVQFVAASVMITLAVFLLCAVWLFVALVPAGSISRSRTP